MTHATIHHINASTMAIEFAYDKDLKEAIAAMLGSDWDKPTKRWLLPVARLGDVVRLFWPNVTLDYDVLRSRDEQLKRMFRQYQQSGVRFWLDDGRVHCDHALLNEWFAANGNKLHAAALEAVQAEQPARATLFKVDYPIADKDDPGLALWLRGVKNARVAVEKKTAMLAAKKRKRRNDEPDGRSKINA